jgi:hypothetical protein
MVFTVLKNEFQWSVSAQRGFNSCKRAFYYDKYGSWGAWEFNASDEVKKVDMLKNLKTEHLWVGQVIHESVRQALIKARAKMHIDPDALVEAMMKSLRTDYNNSKQGHYKVKRKTCGLLHHEYNLLVSETELEALYARAGGCLRNFLNSELFKELMAAPAKEFMFIDEDKPQQFSFEGNKISLKLDFVRVKQEGLQIYDWKTGLHENGEDERTQLGVYALFVLQRFNVPLEKIRAYIFNLNKNTPEQVVLTEQDLERCRALMRAGISEMKSLLDNPEENKASIEKYPKNERECVRGSQICKYKKLCFASGGSVFTGD